MGKTKFSRPLPFLKAVQRIFGTLGRPFSFLGGGGVAASIKNSALRGTVPPKVFSYSGSWRPKDSDPLQTGEQGTE